MRKIITAMLLLFGLQTFACDVCNIFEYANRTNQSYVGLFYRYRLFNGYQFLDQSHNFFANTALSQNSNARQEHEPQFEKTYVAKTKNDYQLFQTTELRFNYSWKSKWNFQAIIPFLSNNIYYQQTITFPEPMQPTKLQLSGIGDIILTSDYVKAIYTGMVRHTIKAGIGLKLPTGNYAQQGNNGNIYDYDIQPGTGSLDFIFRVNYLITNDKWGADAFVNFKLNTRGKNNILIGNKWNLMSNMYYTFTIKKLKLLPKAGLYFEYAERDRINADLYTYSGGYSLFHQYGMDILYSKIIFQVLYQSLIYEKLNGPVIGNAGRLNAGLIYNF